MCPRDMHAHWTSSSGPLFVKTIWVKNYHHVILYDENQNHGIKMMRKPNNMRKSFSAYPTTNVKSNKPRRPIERVNSFDLQVTKADVLFNNVDKLRPQFRKQNWARDKIEDLRPISDVIVKKLETKYPRFISNEKTRTFPSNSNVFYHIDTSVNGMDNKNIVGGEGLSSVMYTSNVGNKNDRCDTLSDRVMMWINLTAQWGKFHGISQSTDDASITNRDQLTQNRSFSEEQKMNNLDSPRKFEHSARCKCVTQSEPNASTQTSNLVRDGDALIKFKNGEETSFYNNLKKLEVKNENINNIHIALEVYKDENVNTNETLKKCDINTNENDSETKKGEAIKENTRNDGDEINREKIEIISREETDLGTSFTVENAVMIKSPKHRSIKFDNSRRQLHIFLPNIPKKNTDCDSNISSQGSSLLLQC